MNTDLPQHELFRSSITINSIKPTHNPGEEIDFFDFQNVNQQDSSHQIQKTEFVNAIHQSDSLLYGSLLDKILFSTHNQPQDNYEQPSYWIAQGDQNGCSESESEQIQKPDTKRDQGQVGQNSSLSYRSKFYLCHHSDYSDDKIQKLSKRFQNETKNIPKNFGKAIIAYSLKNFKNYQHLPEFKSISFHDFKKQLVQKRKSINSIQGLKSLWVDFKYAKNMRMLSNKFLRRHFLSYIFNSRISNISPHIKYRYKLGEAIKNPQEFSHIKEF